MKKSIEILAIVISCLSLTACDGKSFSLGGKVDVFKQDPQVNYTKIDILWVVDNSLSMQSSQDAVAANFQSFIEGFAKTDFDYQIAITTTDSYRALYDEPSLAKFKDGTDDTSHSGVFIINKDTPDIQQVFTTNITQGTKGWWDERGLQSMFMSLTYDENEVSFPRKGAFLSVIFLADEDDFSHLGEESIQGEYDNPFLHRTSSYLEFLDDLTQSEPSNRNYNVNTIGVFDEQCSAQLSADDGYARSIANRYAELSDATNGYKGSLCGNFPDVLSNITDKILTFTTKFYLTSLPEVETITVSVGGSAMPNDATNGWTYDPVENSISFHGNAIPGKNQDVTVAFERATAGK